MISLFLSLLPSHLHQWLWPWATPDLYFILPRLLLLFLFTLFSPLFSSTSVTLIFLIYTLLFSPVPLLGHIHLLIVMIAVRSSAMACRKSELVHVSEHRYALRTLAGSFTDCCSEEGDACMHRLQKKYKVTMQKTRNLSVTCEEGSPEKNPFKKYDAHTLVF